MTSKISAYVHRAGDMLNVLPEVASPCAGATVGRRCASCDATANVAAQHGAPTYDV